MEFINYLNLFEQEIYNSLIENEMVNMALEQSMNDEELKRKDKINVLLEKVKWDKDDEECKICFDNITKGDYILNLDCKHNFHLECLKEWLHFKQDCPICRSHIK